LVRFQQSTFVFFRFNSITIEEQVVVITGASSGVGRAVALSFAAKKAKVVAVARSEEGLKTLVDEITSKGGDAIYIVADVSNFDQVHQVADQTEEKYGRIDTWINNAAVIEFSAVDFTTPEEYRRITEVDYLGQVWGALAALPHVRKTGGTIIFQGSVEARIGFPFLSAYGASKHAVEGFADSLRMELMHEKSPVSIVHLMPAAINTPLFNKARTKLGCKPKSPGPIYNTDEVVKTILWLSVHPRRDVVIGTFDKLILLPLKNLCPSLLDYLISSDMIYKKYFTQEKKLADEDPDNLYKAIPGGKYDTVAGDFTSESGSSWIDTLRRHPNFKAVGLGTIAIGLSIGIFAILQKNKSTKVVSQEKTKTTVSQKKAKVN